MKHLPAFCIALSVCLMCAALALGGCAPRRVEPEIRIVTQDREILRSCVPASVPPPPTYSDSDEALAAAPGGPERYLLVTIGRLERMLRAAVTETVVAGCR